MGNENNSNQILIWIAVIYLIVSQIFAIIFAIDYIKDDDTSIVEAFLFSGIVGEFKGLFWIFFI